MSDLSPEVRHAAEWLSRHVRLDEDVRMWHRAVLHETGLRNLGELAEKHPQRVLLAYETLSEMIEQLGEP